MTQKEILEREAHNTDSIWFYLEGAFYKAYERSAFAFHTRVKEFKVLRKESKTLGRDILYLGFPQAALEKNTSKLLFSRIDEKTIRAREQRQPQQRQLRPSRYSLNRQTPCSRIFSQPITLPARTNEALLPR